MLKNRPIILRIHSSKKKEYREGIYSELLLFCPWRNEKDFREEFDENCEDMFTKYEEVIKTNKKAIYPNAPMIDTMMDIRNNHHTPIIILHPVMQERVFY